MGAPRQGRSTVYSTLSLTIVFVSDGAPHLRTHPISATVVSYNHSVFRFIPSHGIVHRVDVYTSSRRSDSGRGKELFKPFGTTIPFCGAILTLFPSNNVSTKRECCCKDVKWGDPGQLGVTPVAARV